MHTFKNMANKKKMDNITNIKSYFEHVTTLHGTAYFSLLSHKKLAAWTLIMIANVIFIISFILVIKHRYNSDQIITRISTNCNLKQIPVPAISICNFNMVSKKEIKSIARILDINNITEEEVSIFFRNLPNLKDYGKMTTNVNNFTRILNILNNHFFTVDTIMEEVHQKCDNLLVYCSFNRKVKRCGDIFLMTKTFEGHCCTFNDAALNDENKNSLVAVDDDMEYYDDPSEDDVDGDARIIVSSESGRDTGLSVILDIEPDDYANWSPAPYFGAKILINDPNDYPEQTVLYKYLRLEESLDIKVEPLVFQCEDNLRYLRPEKRACWFHDEVTLGYTDRYSYETCKTECKMRHYRQYCGCIPYKYPKDKVTPTCEFKDLACLNNMTAYRLPIKTCDPVCYMECRDKRYSISSDVMPFLRDMFPSNFTENNTSRRLSAVQVYYASSSCNSYRLMLMMDLNYFIATYGGIFSLSFGASILTLCELAYLFVSMILRMLKIEHSK